MGSYVKIFPLLALASCLCGCLPLPDVPLWQLGALGQELDVGSPDEGEALPVEPDEIETSPLLVLSPREYEVFQRRTLSAGSVLISGTLRVDADRVRLRMSGSSTHGVLPGDWSKVPILGDGGGFESVVSCPAGGWYALQLQALRGEEVLAEDRVQNFGVGEVFVGAGQSNSTNWGETLTAPESGMVAAFSGTAWRLAEDPQPGTHDRSQGGSFWPAFGDALYERYAVPIAVATTGHGSTRVDQWQPGGELFAWTLRRVHQLGPGGFRALLWQQGEADAEMSAGEYADKLATIIYSSKATAGFEFPWFVALSTYRDPERPMSPTVRAAQEGLWRRGVAWEGPDADSLGSEYRDKEGQGIHFNARGLRAMGLLWAEAVGAYLDGILSE